MLMDDSGCHISMSTKIMTVSDDIGVFVISYTKFISLVLICYYAHLSLLLPIRSELAFNCLKSMASRFKNSPDLYKIQLEHLVGQVLLSYLIRSYFSP